MLDTKEELHPCMFLNKFFYKYSHPLALGGLVSGPLWIPKLKGAQVPCIR